MTVKFGSARIDENGHISGGKAGDQNGREVCIENGYVHGLGWVVLRPKSVKDANNLAASMTYACNNDNIGYSQSDRYGVVKYGIRTKTKTNADCASLVRACIKDAMGIDPGEFYTGTEKSVLLKTGKFTEVPFTTVSALYTGDVLVTKSKGHTVIVTSGKARTETVAPKPATPIIKCCIQAAYNGTAAQHWAIVPDGEYVKIVNANGKCLDVTHGSLEPMSNDRVVSLYDDNGTDAQRWRMCASPSGGYRFFSKLDERYCLDAAGGPVNKRGYIKMHTAQSELRNMYAQSWHLVESVDGYTRLVNGKSAWVLDSNPTNIQL